MGKSLTAQVELKVNIFGFYYDVPYISAEYFVNEKFGLEVGTGFNSKKVNEIDSERKSMFFVTAKHYLFDNKGDSYDRIFLGLYLSSQVYYRISSSAFRTTYKIPSFIIGGMIGRKWMYTKNIFMEANLGIGLSNNKITYEPNESVFFINEVERKTKAGVFLSFVVGYRFDN